jgi:TRAP-type uncharacterized transport system fused permease subunit
MSVTTGTFTIPLMKRVGFKPEKAGAVEVASSVPTASSRRRSWAPPPS